MPTGIFKHTAKHNKNVSLAKKRYYRTHDNYFKGKMRPKQAELMRRLAKDPKYRKKRGWPSVEEVKRKNRHLKQGSPAHRRLMRAKQKAFYGSWRGELHTKKMARITAARNRYRWKHDVAYRAQMSEFHRQRSLKLWAERHDEMAKKVAANCRFTELHKDPVFCKKRMASYIKPSWPQVYCYCLVCEAFGPGWHLEVPVLPYSLDIAHPAKRIAIEVDGEYWHGLNPAKDRRRDRILKKIGWTVIRIPTKQLKTLTAEGLRGLVRRTCVVI